jgi:hypothetical protein
LLTPSRVITAAQVTDRRAGGSGVPARAALR